VIDLHSHILPGIDDGAVDFSVSLAMARNYVAQGVDRVACTPHILPGLYHNSPRAIRLAVEELRQRLNDAGIPLQLTTGADNHMVPDFVSGLQNDRLLTLGDTKYVLVEPPHHVMPVHIESLFFEILLAGFVPILTHPERLNWIESRYGIIQTLAERGVWMQITSGSLLGKFGRRARYWAERMLSEGLVHIIATDAHDNIKRPPDLFEGRHAVEKLVDSETVEHLFVTHPTSILRN
jgi:protein-tyrosine phosphatase